MRCEKPALLERALNETVTQWGSSRWAEIRRCPRAHKLSVIDNIRPAALSMPLAVGIAVHQVLAYAGLLAVHGEPMSETELVECLDAGEIKGPARAEAFRLLRAYFNRYGTAEAGFAPGYRVVDVEVPMRADIGGVPYTARIDVVLEQRGLLTPCDHKTRGHAVPFDVLGAWSTKPQFLGQAYLARETLGPRWSGEILINAIVKTKVPGFSRVPLRLAPERIDGWAREHSLMAPGLLALAEIGCANFESCAPEVGMRCQFFEYCHGSDRDRETLYQRKEKKDA